MKKLIIIVFLQTFFITNAQKELWGVNKGADDSGINPLGYKGNITKFDINGENPAIIHEFIDVTMGKTPKGKLFLASNEKLYGITFEGGDSSFTPEGFGVLYEYDLILNKYKLVHNFQPLFGTNQPSFGVIEPITGKLFGSFGNHIYTYDFNTEVFSIVSGDTGGYGYVSNQLSMASSGFLYGTTNYISNCPGTNGNALNYGSVFKVNTITNTIQTVYNFRCDWTDGINLNTTTGSFIETQAGKLIGTVTSGFEFANTINGNIFEFDILTNTFSKKIDFDGYNLGSYPLEMVDGSNGILYGICQNGGTNVYTNVDSGTTTTNHFGTLFQYNTASNVVTKLHDFGNQQGPPFYFTGGNPTSIMKTSTGNYFGTMLWGLYKFNPADNSVIMPIPPGCATCPENAFVTESLIEICRKPSYQEIVVNTYTPEVGSTFTYNINNTNATTYVWKKSTTILPLQTTGILNLTNVTTNDTGVYTCTMTNECGTTVTANLNINVSNLGTDTIDNYKEQITLYPNPTKGSVNLKFPENRGLKGLKYKITNLLGQTIKEQEITKINYKNELTIDTAGFVKGVYQLTLTTDKGDWLGKFVKE